VFKDYFLVSGQNLDKKKARISGLHAIMGKGKISVRDIAKTLAV
jgi:hypothetical protein